MRVRHGSEYFEVDKRGYITRPEIGMNEPSGQWFIVGAVQLNNFGHVVRRYTAKEVLEGAVTGWTHKNGKQRVHMLDNDHGTIRMWGNPTHEVLP